MTSCASTGSNRRTYFSLSPSTSQDFESVSWRGKLWSVDLGAEGSCKNALGHVATCPVATGNFACLLPATCRPLASFAVGLHSGSCDVVRKAAKRPRIAKI